MDNYKNLDLNQYFQELYQINTVNNPEYNLYKGQIYEKIKEEKTEPQAQNIVRLLHNGEIQEAEEKTEQLLEPSKN